MPTPVISELGANARYHHPERAIAGHRISRDQCPGTLRSPAVLEMRLACERCNKALPLDGDACICSYECTFCPACTREMSSRCPNCGGELLPRPRRTQTSPSSA